MASPAEQHKTDILKTADAFYKGLAPSAVTTERLQKIFGDALADGSAQELLASFHAKNYGRQTPVGMPNVWLDDERNCILSDVKAPFHHLDIQPGMFEHAKPGPLLNAARWVADDVAVDFRITTDSKSRTVVVSLQPFDFQAKVCTSPTGLHPAEPPKKPIILDPLVGITFFQGADPTSTKSTGPKALPKPSPK